ncbi:MAG TPA: polysaccharide deacetylase family protein, partial [Nitrosospira sp.]
GLFHVARWLTRNHLKILCYHGFTLADEAEFRPKLFIRPEQFEKRLTAIDRYRLRVLPLQEAIERLYERSLPGGAIVITVDDGFHSVHRLAVPRLQRHGYPATVYVTTYYVQNPNPVFRLVIQYMFWKTRKQELVLRNVSWAENKVVDLRDPVQAEQTMWDCINHGERECEEKQRCTICAELGELLETPYEEIVRSRMFHLMTPDELRSLSPAGVRVELHTHRHIFPSDDQSLAEREIADNRAALTQWLPSETQHFCYPSGLWDERQWAWLDNMNVKSSTTCVPGLNSSETPRHALRRFLDGENIHQLEFEAAISGFSDLLRALRRTS